MKRPEQFSFRSKLLLALFGVGIVPAAICTVLMVSVYRVALQKNADEAALQSLRDAQQGFECLLKDCEAACRKIAHHDMVMAALAEPTSAAETDRQVYNALVSGSLALSGRTDFSLYDADGRLRYSVTGAKPEPILRTQWGLLSAANNADGVTYRAADAEADEICFKGACAIEDGSGIVGYVVFSVSRSQLSQLFRAEEVGKTAVLLLDPRWHPVYQSASVTNRALADTLRTQLLEDGKLKDAANEYDYSVAQIERSGFYLVLQCQKPIGMGALQLFYLVFAAAVLCCFVFAVVMSFGLSGRLMHPIQDLNDAMKQVEQGNLSIQLPVQGTDEFSQLTGRFNRMTARLNGNLQMSLAQQKELSETQIRMLQAQLNPHFLYNTLDTVKWMGKLHHIPVIATIASDLADILRYSIGGEEFVPLEQELTLLNRYVEIQQIRFENRFSYEMEIQPALRRQIVPKLILQPLVENAILHGFEDGRAGHILVTAHAVGGEAVLTVEDDGNGKTVQEYRSYLQQAEKQRGHFGLGNVNTILRLHYGEEHGLQFVAPPEGQGTCIRIALPLDPACGNEMPKEDILC